MDNQKKHPSRGIKPGRAHTQRNTRFFIPEFLLLLLSKAPYIALAALLGCAFSLGYSSLALPPLYTATAKLYVLGQESIDPGLPSLRTGTLLTIDYQEVFGTWEVQQEVMHALGSEAQKLCPDRLEIRSPEGTRVLYIRYTDDDPALAAKTANSYALAGRRFMFAAMDLPQPLLFSMAAPPSERSSMGQKDILGMGFVWGIAFAVCVIFLKFTFDQHPRGPQDVEAAAGLPTLAVIPVSEAPSDAQKSRRRRLWNLEKKKERFPS